jgi:hypothetical protein
MGDLGGSVGKVTVTLRRRQLSLFTTEISGASSFFMPCT